MAGDHPCPAEPGALRHGQGDGHQVGGARRHACARDLSAMSYAKVLCAALVGAGGHVAEVEACVAPGLPAVIMTGLPDPALYESRERVRTAISNSGGAWPYQRISV